ncbi:hypothetical protein H6G17_20935 [Chroococcidiopsis sp. FACHB-1243]|uniref:hypothetical protein n=1 Tax=Chroococcidiopsis sp. [FACHB-1243] TaxID=2692781 RepID=UPI001781E3DD|nr:hypothetical protein [Chroococcidiopsis sp. [FACHB-1243]]MBD2307939.1 hypothetical protein [Chroococcidiopsis sp. [FACHB-1243]]
MAVISYQLSVIRESVGAHSSAPVLGSWESVGAHSSAPVLGSWESVGAHSSAPV